jgi:hypothetical protein
MKTLRISLIAIAALFVAAAAQAQQTKVMADVPFSFVVGDRAYPAGEYTLASNGAVLLIEATEQTSAANVLSIACENALPAQQTKLVFHRTGDTLFLYQIWVAGDQYGREFPRSKTETRMAQNHDKSENVIVAANLVR